MLILDGPDNGDLPNIYVGENGSVTAEIYTKAVAVMENSDSAMSFDEYGPALVVHENSDNHVIEPIGGVGGRVSCGVIKKEY